MKLLVIGDPHLKISRFELVKQFLEWVNKTVIEIQPDLIVNLGDTFDTHAVVRSEILTEFRNHVIELTENGGFQYYYILGNHDMYKPNDSKYHALDSLSNISNFHVIDEDTHHRSTGISWIPYKHSASDFPSKTLPICIAHQTFVGADFGYFRPDNGVDADAVSAEIIISGHIHKRQSFGKVIYPGTPFAQGIDDINQSKGLMLFDTDNYQYSFIESPFPRWRGLKYDLSMDSVDTVHGNLNDSLNDVDNWVIELTGPKAEIVSYMDSKKFIKLKSGKSLRVKPIYIDNDKNSSIKIKSLTPLNIVEEYVDNIYSGSLDKKELKTVIHEILSDVKCL